MPNCSTGSLKGKILALAQRTGETPAEALETAIQEKLEMLSRHEIASLEPDSETFERLYGGLPETDEWEC